MKLGQELNATYIAYGQKGTEKKKRQATQDSFAKTAGVGVMAQRAVAKASKQYKNEAWDLVDAEKEGSINVEELDEAELPAEMQKMTPKERKQHIEKMAKEREELQKKINKLNEERRKYVAEQRKNSPDNTLDAAIIQAVQEQAQKKKYAFE
ncbi:hypothetical protein ACFL27_19185 [candidate division CSSED10-310 bacterium]|uniref:EF-hand domain-containing protein n=1 Tax=candidate division CSSED10-310 bacterium TaxID=2855610 RepID=A0ABV6Z1K4_UNCC1